MTRVKRAKAGVGSTLSEELRSLRRRGAPVSLTELAARLFALPGAPSAALARRLVAAALECSPRDLPERVERDLLWGPDERQVASVPLEDAAFIVVDLETTGFTPAQAEILEIGAIRVEAGEGVGRPELGSEFESLVKPSAPIPARICALTGIDDHTARAGLSLPEALRAWQAWRDSTPSAPLVAHNAAFDERFLRAALTRCGMRGLGVPMLCTRRLARRLVPELGRYSLDYLCAHFGVSNRARHRALGDARAAARVLLELLERARTRGLDTIGALLDLQQDPPSGLKGRKRPTGPATGTSAAARARPADFRW